MEQPLSTVPLESCSELRSLFWGGFAGFSVFGVEGLWIEGLGFSGAKVLVGFFVAV